MDYRHSKTDPMRKTRKNHSNFWANVQKTETCWTWIGSLHSAGYGIINRRRDTAIRAHRVSYEMAFGPIPEGLHVLHHCDNPPCVRPDHLFLGTAVDNVNDMMAKGRNHIQIPATVTFQCLQCGRQQTKLRREAGTARYCDTKCAALYRGPHLKRPPIIFTCRNCGQTVARSKHDLGRGRFCSRLCAAQWKHL